MLRIIADVVIYILLGAGLAWFFYYWKRKDLVGGYLGALLVGLVGCILGAFAFSSILEKIIHILQKGFYLSNVNIIASLIGGYAFLYIFNYFNHNRERQSY